MDNSESSVNEFDKLAEQIAEKWYGGKLPRCPAVIVRILLGTIPDVSTELPKVPAEVIEEAKLRWADALLLALRERITAQDADEKSQFAN